MGIVAGCELWIEYLCFAILGDLWLERISCGYCGGGGILSFAAQLIERLMFMAEIVVIVGDKVQCASGNGGDVSMILFGENSTWLRDAWWGNGKSFPEL